MGTQQILQTFHSVRQNNQALAVSRTGTDLPLLEERPSSPGNLSDPERNGQGPQWRLNVTVAGSRWGSSGVVKNDDASES